MSPKCVSKGNSSGNGTLHGGSDIIHRKTRLVHLGENTAHLPGSLLLPSDSPRLSSAQPVPSVIRQIPWLYHLLIQTSLLSYTLRGTCYTRHCAHLSTAPVTHVESQAASTQHHVRAGSKTSDMLIDGSHS